MYLLSTLICLSIYPSTNRSTPSILPSIHLFINPSIHSSLYPSIVAFIYPLITHLSIYLSIYVFIHPSFLSSQKSDEVQTKEIQFACTQEQLQVSIIMMLI